MPEEWGPRFYRKFSQKKEFDNLPVIVISGLSGIHLAIRKAVATVNKPFDPAKVLEVVGKRHRQALDGLRRPGGGLPPPAPARRLRFNEEET